MSLLPIIPLWRPVRNCRLRPPVRIEPSIPLMYFLYSTLLGLALVFSAPWWLLRMARHGKYRAGLRERLGNVPHRVLTGDSRRTIWIHAVSMGEVLAVANLIAKLRNYWPDHR